MKIVIDLPKETYKRFIDEWTGTTDVLQAVRQGTPLPEHHGRLGDLDALEKEIINGIKAGNYEDGYEEYAHINDMDDCVECVKYAPTIIEGSERK